MARFFMISGSMNFWAASLAGIMLLVDDLRADLGAQQEVYKDFGGVFAWAAGGVHHGIAPQQGAFYWQGVGYCWVFLPGL